MPPQPDGVLDDTSTPAPAEPNAGGLPFVPPQKPAAPPAPVDEPADDVQSAGSVASEDLLLVKQEALKELSPLVEHLEQSPEEKFRTTMMMIQASDDEKLVKQAFEAAKQITDDKIRAQALLDVINEINYFTQQTEK
jgi:hypothetical protein